MTAVHIIENEYLKVVVSELGAELQSIINKKNNKEYLWQGSKEIWPRKAPVLFPIVGKVFNDTYYHEGKSYKLTQHGFARDEAFDMLMSGSQQLTFLLTENATTLEKYPFPFNLYIGYTLDGPKIKVLYEVQNTGETDMYFSIGGHPGFNCPLEGKGTYEDYFLELPQETLEIFPLQEGGYQAGTKTTLSTLGRKLNLSKNLFKNDALVFKNGEVTQVRLWNKDRNEGIGLSTTMPYFGIWTKKDTDKFVCLEPWAGIADYSKSTELKDKEGINLLSKGQIFNSNYEIEVL